MKDGVPIGLGYFAVSFSLGIAAHSAGFDVIQGFVLSLLNVASAGEYAGISMVAIKATLYELIFLSLITNARYLLMSCALSQKLPEDMPFFHRLLIGFGVTDELFGIGIAYEGKVPPIYLYGAYVVAIPLWAIGTAFGVVAGNLLPGMLVDALSVAIFGMFIAIIIPPAKKNKIVAATVAISFVLSAAVKYIPVICNWSDGIKTIVLTVLIAGGAAWFFPVDEEKSEVTE
ncbi:MAG: AzlC family ABC transporter permease [Lachnospiraceae bacterium]|nr:AzlC family ABC transporter permease [Lachnospiraceae bacterium]